MRRDLVSWQNLSKFRTRRLQLYAAMLILAFIVSSSVIVVGYSEPPSVALSSRLESLQSSVSQQQSLSDSTVASHNESIAIRTGPTVLDPPEPTGVVVPVFVEPLSAAIEEYNQIIQVKTAYPRVPIMVVVNPADGPGTYISALATAIEKMQSVGIIVLGYTPTEWGERPIASVEADMVNYREWYGVNGIYLDQMPNWEYNGPNGTWYYYGTGGESITAYFENLTDYAMSLGFTKVTGNSGADVPQNFIGSVSTIGIWENNYLPSLSASAGWYSLLGLGGWHVDYNKNNFMFFAYNVTSLNPEYVLAAANVVSYMYLTNQPGPAPYGQLPSYFSQLVSILATHDGAGGIISTETIGS